MELWQNLLWVGGGLLVVLFISLLPGHLGKALAILGLNALAGLAVLGLINLFSGFTQLFLPLNGITVAISSLLGVPGIMALAVLALV